MADTTGNARTKLNDWLKTKITKERDKELLKNEDWCIGDRTSAYDTSTFELKTEKVEELIEKRNDFGYSAIKRIFNTKVPTLKCDGNKETDGEIDVNKIGMLSIDEVAFAGSSQLFTENSTYYLNKNATSNTWWTFSLANYSAPSAYVLSFGVFINGSNGFSSVNNNNLRPVVTLISGTEISDGDGTVNNAYVVK